MIKRIIIVVIYMGLSIVLLMAFYNLKISFNNNNISINNTNTEINEELEKYVIGVVACEMPALYDIEALKAQAVAARTFTIYTNDYEAKEQCYNSYDQLQTKWGDKYPLYIEKITKAVNATTGLVMKKSNFLFKSFYFSTSNGKTEDSKTVFKEGEIKSVESSWDKESSNYLKELHFTKENLEKKLGTFDNINIVKRDKNGYVSKVQVDNKEYTGIEMRSLLNLRSTDFDIKKENQDYLIVTRGYGHGVGMSQYGANYLAKKGYDYKYILKYYYGDISIEKI